MLLKSFVDCNNPWTSTCLLFIILLDEQWSLFKICCVHGSLGCYCPGPNKCLEKEVCANLDIILISETKLDGSPPSEKFLLNGFSKANKLDRCKIGDRIFLYIRNYIPARLLSNSNKTESIFAGINFRKNKWLICTSYNRHKSNLKPFAPFEQKSRQLYGNYDNILLLGDFNSEFSEPCLNDFCYIYNLKNLVKVPACFQNLEEPSCIDLFLTDRTRTFQCTTTIGISNFLKLVFTVLKSFCRKQRPKMIHCRNFKNFENDNFGQDLKKRNY